MYSKDSPIVVVGAGVFGLSNALHLAQSGYTNVTVFDRLDFNANHYTLLEGADTASADVNKIFRAQYAGKMHYQKLAFQALIFGKSGIENCHLLLLPNDQSTLGTRFSIFVRC